MSNWSTETNFLTYYGTVVTLNGVSLTSTEYIAAEYAQDSYYNFSTMSVTQNLSYVVNLIVQIYNIGSGNTIPCLRIPMCADYWLYGSGTYVNDPPTITNGSVNVAFTAAQYQQAIIDIINYVDTNVNSTLNPSGNPSSNITVVYNLDLHWNYSTEQPKQSYNGTSGNNFNSGQQLAMAGVFISGSGNTGTLPDNTISFWTSVASTFGVDADGNELISNSVSSNVKPNIFFELYNEPFTDQLVTNAYEGYQSTLSYTSNYSIYVNGGEAYLNSTDNLFSFTGMGQIYNEIRAINCNNIVIVGGADSYSYIIFNSGSQWSYPYDGNPAPNSILNTYNCYNSLQSGLNNGTIPVSSYTKTSYTGYYPSTSLTNVLANLHPYCGLYSGASKAPGYYNSGYPGNNQPGFGQIVTALQNQSLNQFSISFPIICTEFGQYDLPWSNYNNGVISNGDAYQYNQASLSYPANPEYIVPSGVTLGTPYYIGYWINSSGQVVYGPPIIGYLEDFINLYVSFTAWAMRPNSSGSGNGIGCNPDTTGFGWQATQPDTFSGGYNYPGTNPAGSSSCSTSLGMFVISSENQQLNSTYDSTTGSYTNLGANNLNGYQGPDFNYILTNYF